MEPKPVRVSKTPSYPTRREVLAGAATFTLASFAGCWRVLGETADGKAIVAPIFEHGTGRGATGCVVVSPPVFLSEEEAMQIIREELAKHGIRLKDGKVLEGVRLCPRSWRDEQENGKVAEEIDIDNDPEWRTVCEKEPAMRLRFAPKPLKLDGMDSDKKVAVEFISESKYRDSGGTLDGGTAMEHDFIDAAKYVAGKVEKEGKDCIYFGVFYDPAVESPSWFDDDLENTKTQADLKSGAKDAKEESKKLLREQVQDFAGWLKEKKVVP